MRQKSQKNAQADLCQGLLSKAEQVLIYEQQAHGSGRPGKGTGEPSGSSSIPGSSKARSRCWNACSALLARRNVGMDLQGVLPLFSLLCSSQQLLPQRQTIRLSVVVDLFSLFTQTELVEILIQKQQSISFLVWRCSRMGNPIHQFASHGLDLCVAVSFLLAEYMPNRHQQLASDGHNGLLLANTSAQTLKLGFLMSMMFDRNPGCFDHDPTKVTATFLGNVSSSAGFPRLVNTGS